MIELLAAILFASIGLYVGLSSARSSGIPPWRPLALALALGAAGGAAIRWLLTYARPLGERMPIALFVALVFVAGLCVACCLGYTMAWAALLVGHVVRRVLKKV